MVGAALAGGTGVVVTWVVARALGAEQAGAFFAATAAFVLAGGVAKLGTQTGLVYWPARLRATGRDDLLGSCLRTGLGPVILLSAVLAGAMWLGAPAIARLTAGDTPHVIAEHTTGLRVLAVFLPLQVLTDVLLTATRGYRAMRPTVMLDRVVRSALQLLCVGAVGVTALWMTASLPAFALAWAAPYLPVAVLAGYALHRTYLRANPPGVRTRRLERQDLRRDFWRFTGPRAVASVAQLALQRVDVLLVAALAGLAAAAVYAVAGRFVVLDPVRQPGHLAVGAAPARRGAGHRRPGHREPPLPDRDRLAGAGHLADQPAGDPLRPALPGPVRRPSYRAGAPVVVVLACAMLVATGCGMVDMVLAMAGRTSWNLVNVLVALAVTIGLDVLLIPAYGALGAAIGLACAVVVNNLLPLIQVGRTARLHPFGPGTSWPRCCRWRASAYCRGCVTALAGTGAAGLLLAAGRRRARLLLRGVAAARPLGLDAFYRRSRTPRRTVDH